MGADKGKDDHDWIVRLEKITLILTDTEDSLGFSDPSKFLF